MVAQELHCRGCGYDLRGLQARSRCPECGLLIWTSVVHTIDPAASRMPSLRNPVAVGNSLVCLTIVMLLGALLMIGPRIEDLLEHVPRWRIWWRDGELGMWWGAATVLGLAGLWAIWNIAPPKGAEPQGAVWVDIWRMALGLVGWLVFAALGYEFATPVWRGSVTREAYQVLALAISSGFAVVGLLGLRGIFAVIGLRSREYRRSRGGRQSVELIIAAIMIMVMAAVIAFLPATGWLSPEWEARLSTPALMVMGVSAFMVLIGLAYLVLNAWWIRRALRRPSPPIGQVLLRPVANAPHLGDTGET